jgi:hypothetical protein
MQLGSFVNITGWKQDAGRLPLQAKACTISSECDHWEVVGKSASNMAIASHRIGWRESWRLVDRYWQYWHGYRRFQTVHAISWLASFIQTYITWLHPLRLEPRQQLLVPDF